MYVDGVLAVELGSAKNFREQLAAVGEVPVLRVEINCDGGEITEGMAIYSALRAHPARKVGVVMGIAASMASVVLMACDERRVAKGACVMIHMATGGARGTPEQIEAAAASIRKMQSELLDIYEARTKLSREQLLAAMAVDNYLTAEECVAQGFADAVETFEARVPYEAVARLARVGVKLPASVRVTPAATNAKGNPVMKLSPEQVKQIVDYLAAEPESPIRPLLESLMSDGADAPAGPAEGDPASATGEPADDPPVPAAAASAADAPATAMLLRVTGAKDLASAEPILRSAITSARSIDADRQAVTMTARRELIAELIALGAETPATAWDGKAEDLKPKARLLNEPLEEMRARITSLKARNGGGGHTPPVSSAADLAGEVSKLTVEQLATIKAKGLTPEAFVAARAKATRGVARPAG